MLLFILGIDFPSNSIFKIIPILIFGVTLPFYYLFKFDVTSEEEIIILFENLLSNLDHFSRRNVFWRKISKKIEEVLKTGNIEVSKDDLIYYFNDKRWETNSNITNQLRDIELWLLDKRRTCFDSIRQIVPVVCFQPIKRKPLLKNIALEPTSAQVEIIKVLGYVIVAVLLIVLIIVHPDLGNQIINHLPSL